MKNYLGVFDPSFVVLAMAASVEAIFLSTFVLISQNRMQAQAEQRSELDLQISLLAEHEVTQVMTLLDAVAKKLGIDHVGNRDIEETKQDVDPRQVLDAITNQTGRDDLATETSKVCGFALPPTRPWRIGCCTAALSS